MITAKEAKAIYDESGVEVATFLKNKVENAVKNAAFLGNRTVFIHVDSHPDYLRVNASPFQAAVVTELIRLGYAVKFGTDGNTYVPRSLEDNTGDGPLHKNYGFIISW